MKLQRPNQQGFTLIELLVVMTIIAVLAAVGFTAFTRAQETSRISAATQNLKGNIYAAIFQYASDNGDKYPSRIIEEGEIRDAANANEAFRQLFIGDYLSDETVFEVTPSPAFPDGDIGESPNYQAALENQECHWSIILGSSISSSGSFPIVWENSVSDGWDPTWDPTIDESEKGRTWSNGRVLVLMQGGAVKQGQLESKDEAGPLGDIGSSNNNLFTQSNRTREALDPLLN